MISIKTGHIRQLVIKISKNTNKITIGVIDAETIVDGEKGVLKLKHIDLICDMIQELVPQAKNNQICFR